MSKPQKSNFLIGRIKSVRYAVKGAWILISTEHSIMMQLMIAGIMTFAGFLVGLSTTEWLFQITAIALVLISEGVNSAIEYLCDFIHPEYHKEIGKIKDIAAGIPMIAAVFALIIGLIIYLPKIPF